MALGSLATLAFLLLVASTQMLLAFCALLSRFVQARVFSASLAAPHAPACACVDMSCWPTVPAATRRRFHVAAAAAAVTIFCFLHPHSQVKSQPPVPALRLVLLSNLIAEAAMVFFHLLPKLLLACMRHARQRRLAATAGLPTAAPGSGKASPKQPGGGSCHSSDDGGSDSSPRAEPVQQQQQQGRPRLAPSKTTVRPPVAFVRGLSRRMDAWEAQGRPMLRKRLALAAITVSFMGCCSLQLLAPGFVDASIGGCWVVARAAASLWAVQPRGAHPPRLPAYPPTLAVQLTTQWTSLCIALAQALLLRHRLPPAFWPCVAVVLGGALMIIIPAVGQVRSAPQCAGAAAPLRGFPLPAPLLSRGLPLPAPHPSPLSLPRYRARRGA